MTPFTLVSGNFETYLSRIWIQRLSLAQCALPHLILSIHHSKEIEHIPTSSHMLPKRMKSRLVGLLRAPTIDRIYRTNAEPQKDKLVTLLQYLQDSKTPRLQSPTSCHTQVRFSGNTGHHCVRVLSIVHNQKLAILDPDWVTAIRDGCPCRHQYRKLSHDLSKVSLLYTDTGNRLKAWI